MKVILSTIGSSGDINPFIAIARSLQDRGHETTMLINPFFESAARQASIGYLPLGEEMDFRLMSQIKNITHPRKGGFAVMRELVLPNIRLMHDRMDEAIRSVAPDVAVLHHICIGAGWAYESRAVPYATVVLAPSLWLNYNDRSVFAGMPDSLPHMVLRAGMWVGERQCRWLMDPSINRARRDLGLPPARDWIFSDARGGELNLGMWSPVMRPPMPGDPPNGVLCGFPWHDRFQRFEDRADEVSRYIDECKTDGDEPVLFTLGTAVVHLAGSFYHDAAEACRRLGRRGILITNRGEYAPRPHELPVGVKAFEYAPFSRVMPRVACSVHHGGIGTTAQGLKSGRPTVIIPHAYDQFDNAARARRLGVSATLSRTRVNSGRLTRALRDMLDNHAARTAAESIGATLSTEDGALTAAIEIEKLAASRRTS